MIVELENAYLINVKGGSYNRFGDTKGNRTTRVKTTGLLVMHFEGLEVPPYAIGRHEDIECIILNNTDTNEFGEPIGKKKSKPIEYHDTPETNQWREELTAYNNQLAATYIDIGPVTV